jgi:O-antigen ligase
MLIVFVVAPVGAVQLALGGLIDTRALDAWFAVVAFAIVVLILVAPRALLVTALPATYLYYRVGPSSTELSLADVMLALALVAAVPFVPWRAPALRSMFKALGAYLVILAVPVVSALSSRGVVEWGHRAFLVGGGVVVGAAIASTGRITQALRAFIVASGVVAVAAIAYASTHPGHGLVRQPAYPFGIQKNAAGFLLACALIAVMVAAPQVALPRRLRLPTALLLVVGFAACQARGSAVMLVAVLVLWQLRARGVRASPVVLVGCGLLVAVTYMSVNAAFQSDSKDARFNSVNSRLATYDASIKLWKHDPLVGVGLKYWRDPAFAGETAFGEPHDLFVSALGESGVVGLVGLVTLLGATMFVLARSRSDLAPLALIIVVAKVVDSTVGIYWVAGTLTFAWIAVGLACATRVAHTRDTSIEEAEDRHAYAG